MYLVRKAKVADLAIIKKAMYGIDNEKHNFYSDPVKSVFLHLIRRNCYLLIKKGITQGVIISKTSSKEVFYYPYLNREISFPSLLLVLKKNLNLRGFRLLLNYKNIDINTVKEYFGINVISNFKYMYLKLDQSINLTKQDNTNFNFKIRRAILNVDEGVRVVLQNRIFGDVRGRKELTLDEVSNEAKDSKFIKDLCFILEIDNVPSGYGQILLINGRYILVNFGIIPEYRGMGYSYIFIEEIISKCISYGIEELFLSVDNINKKALGLYKNVGFQQINNTAVIEL
jgi:GNAT superfamily N-acetyltransferase